MVEGEEDKKRRNDILALLTYLSEWPKQVRRFYISENYELRTTAYLAHTPTSAMLHWQRDREAAELLAGMIANDKL
jgi:hypothetical protein